MSLTRPRRFWPRSLRWRLVTGFVLSVIALQILLTVAERVVVQRALQQSIQVNLQAAIKPAVSDALQAQHKTLVGARSGSGPSTESLIAGMEASLQLPSLASRLALPDQPVLLLDQRGQVLS